MKTLTYVFAAASMLLIGCSSKKSDSKPDDKPQSAAPTVKNEQSCVGEGKIWLKSDASDEKSRCVENLESARRICKEKQRMFDSTSGRCKVETRSSETKAPPRKNSTSAATSDQNSLWRQRRDCYTSGKVWLENRSWPRTGKGKCLDLSEAKKICREEGLKYDQERRECYGRTDEAVRRSKEQDEARKSRKKFVKSVKNKIEATDSPIIGATVSVDYTSRPVKTEKSIFEADKHNVRAIEGKIALLVEGKRVKVPVTLSFKKENPGLRTSNDNWVPVASNVQSQFHSTGQQADGLPEIKNVKIDAIFSAPDNRRRILLRLSMVFDGKEQNFILEAERNEGYGQVSILLRNNEENNLQTYKSAIAEALDENTFHQCKRSDKETKADVKIKNAEKIIAVSVSQKRPDQSFGWHDGERWGNDYPGLYFVTKGNDYHHPICRVTEAQIHRYFGECKLRLGNLTSEKYLFWGKLGENSTVSEGSSLQMDRFLSSGDENVEPNYRPVGKLDFASSKQKRDDSCVLRSAQEDLIFELATHRDVTKIMMNIFPKSTPSQIKGYVCEFIDPFRLHVQKRLDRCDVGN